MEPLTLFPPWIASDWTSQNDTLRGGSSTSYLHPTPDHTKAIFGGFVDTKTLGGAGFASQRTTGVHDWNLSKFDGLEIVVNPNGEGKNDPEQNKKVTLVLKDRVFEDQEAEGRERSTVSYEYTFLPSGKMFIPWRELKPFYRGREVKEDDKMWTQLDTKHVKRLSWMCRSFFEEQSGAFVAEVVSVKAVRRVAEEDDALDQEDETTATGAVGLWAAKAQKVAEVDARCGVDDLDEEMDDIDKEKDVAMRRAETKPREDSKCCTMM
ncbi:complex I intermediate-associated protein 30-domain-containing protein [Geopyxis carbonaria]|nr:complex I intermediate-associated protein 30-domain-containing protein [Geopyxis carbonaria]